MIKKTEGANIWSKCEWYQHGEKPIKFFMNLEKQKSKKEKKEKTKNKNKNIKFRIWLINLFFH